jgi:pyruvate/2-oxoglutarate/acetoin dehydrogenase E1 component
MDYFEHLVEAMTWLDKQDKTIFIGQSVRWDGHAMFKTMKNVSFEKRLEFPVMEDFQMGFSTGMALDGFISISIFPRWDFLIVATNQFVNHLDKFPVVGHGKFNPKVIIRTSVGSKEPLNPGPQHCQDYTEAFTRMLKTVEVIDLLEKDDILPSYQKAYLREDGRSTLLVEHMDFYHKK